MTRGPCEKCGERRWAHGGYCLGACAGSPFDPDWPKTKPRTDEELAEVVKKAKAKKPRGPRKGARQTEILYYREMKGSDPPWMQKDDNHA